MIKKITGIDLLKRNFDRVETKFIDFFEKGQPRWPSEKHDLLRNHHQNLAQFIPETISWEKLKVKGLPDDILQEAYAAFDAFKRGEDYVISHQ
ncbi:MAG: hypothetical protein J0H74_23555 [Chitinophagaceae bacterium]|nr:hypothetical protein [Chitinophagaceae bacterium]